MPGRLRCRKRKSAQSRGSRKVGPSRSSCASSSVDSELCEESSRSGISCECEQFSDRRRCSASPQPRHDKENQQEERMECEDSGKTLFPDDDSNEVLPVEQFFGNMDTVQDFPQKTSAPSTSAQRAQRRRRYYAPPEDREDIWDRDEDQEARHCPAEEDCPTEEDQDCPAQRH